MSLDSLAELVSATGNAVKLDSTHSSGASSKIKFMNAGSPFDSPRSIKSLSEKDFQSYNTDSGVGKTDTISKSQTNTGPSKTCRNAMGMNGDGSAAGDETGVDLEEDATVIEIIPCLPVNTSSSQKQSVENLNISTSSSQKVSISKRHLREILSPVGDSADKAGQSSVSSLNSQGSKELSRQDKNGRHIRASERLYQEGDSLNANRNNNRISDDDVERGSVATASSFSDQPEIIDIPERVVAVTSGMSSTSGDDTVLNLIDKVEEANQPPGTSEAFFGYKSFGKDMNLQSHSLKQGAPNKGSLDPTKSNLFDDVYISQFGLTEKQKGLKEALAKRAESNKPKKKFVQPQIIRSKFYSDEDTDRDSEKGRPSTAPAHTAAADPAVAAAVAASAAIAATQPFLKAQHDLETRMQELLSQLAELQQNKNPGSEGGKTVDSENRIVGLEKQVAELNERRFEHLETLQQQQMQMQAQLLYMTRSKSPSNQFHSKRKASPPRPHQTSRIPQAVTKCYNPGSSRGQVLPAQYSYQPNIPFSHSMYNQSMQSQPSFNPATLSKHHNYLNEVRELQGSHLDTPAPRDKVPKPMPYNLPQEPQKNLGFLEELLAQNKDPNADTTFSVMGGYSPAFKLDSDRNNSSRGRRRGDQSPVDKAKGLVTSLSNLERETADSVWGSRDGLHKADSMEIDLGPAPLERYLKYPEKEGSPYPKLGHHSKEKKSRLHNMENLLEAKSVLRQLESTRETLEKNIDQVVRSRRDMHVFTTLLGSAPEGATDEQLKIEKMVNKRISALQGDVQREVLRGLAQEEADRLAAQAEEERQKVMMKRNLAKGDTARTGTLKSQAERSARLAYSKSNAVPTKSFASMGKENRTIKARPVPKPAAIKDPETVVRTYGKPDYQRGRTTIRDPYMHFKNPKRGVTAKSSATTLNESCVSRDGRSRSPKGRQGYGQVMNPTPRQFYFSPTRGYIPLSAGDTAPLHGQLVSMAIPLGEPRLEPGVRRSAVSLTTRTSNPVTSTPVPVTAARNVAMVSFPVEDERREHEREPELAKQVLPPIDIDSISPSSSRRSDIQIRSPQQGNANVTFLYDTREGVDDGELDRTLTEEDSDLEQSGVGIKLPGYEPKQAEYSGPNFPPRTSKPAPGWMAGGGEAGSGQLVSDIMAEDLRRRDVVEENAVQWLEQELMARILTQVMPLEVPDKAGDVTTAQSVKSDESDREDSLLVADMIGQGGMQLFIDAGQPVDNGLVQALVKEVIQEKVNNMLSQRSREDEGQAGGVKVRDDVEQAMQEREKVFSGPPRVPTPEPTPKSSPVPSPRRIRHQPPQPATPPQSPPPAGYKFRPIEPKPEVLPEPVRRRTPPPPPEPQPIAAAVESESETSVSIDISEELRRIAGQGKPSEPSEPIVMRHDVATPPISPPPMAEEEKQAPFFPQRQATPPASPPPASPPRARTPSPKREEVMEETEEEEEEEEEHELEQPKPILMSIAVGDDRPMTAERSSERRSPSPKRPRTPVSTMSETTSPPSTDSSVTETVNDILSEGQWLLSRSEGQLMGPVNYDAIRKELIQRGFHAPAVDASTASTLRDTDDLDLDAEGTKSEGEFLYSGFPDPDKDPMLEVLAEMQKKPMGNVRQIMSGPAPREVMSNTGRSLGEMSAGQIPPSKVAMGQRKGERRQKGRRSPQRSPSPKMERSLEEDYSYQEERRERRQQRSRTPSPLQQQQMQRSRTPPPQQERRSRTPPAHGASRGRPRGQMQYQPVLSEGAPMATRGRTPLGPRGRSSEGRLSHSSDPGRRSRSTYQSDSVSRSADSTSIRRSGEGVLTSSFKSRQSGVKKSVEFDLTGTYGRSERSSVRGSRDSSGRLSDPNRSLGLTYSFEDSLDESELKRIVGSTGSGTGPYRMSVTLPSTAAEEESELSEIDISDK